MYLLRGLSYGSRSRKRLIASRWRKTPLSVRNRDVCSPAQLMIQSRAETRSHKWNVCLPSWLPSIFAVGTSLQIKTVVSRTRIQTVLPKVCDFRCAVIMPKCVLNSFCIEDWDELRNVLNDIKVTVGAVFFSPLSCDQIFYYLTNCFLWVHLTHPAKS